MAPPCPILKWMAPFLACAIFPCYCKLAFCSLVWAPLALCIPSQCDMVCLYHTRGRALRNRAFEPSALARMARCGMVDGRCSFGWSLEWRKTPDPAQNRHNTPTRHLAPKNKNKKPILGLNGGLQSATGAWGWGWGVCSVPPSRWARQ